MPKVVITTDALFQLAGPYLDLLSDAGFSVGCADRVPRDEADLVRVLNTADAVIAGSDPYTDQAMSKLPQLRVISRCGVGYDTVDLEAATRRVVAVTITPNGNHEAVAEHTLTLLLAAARRVPQNDRAIRAGIWQRPQLTPLRGRTLGLVGLGRIGRSVALRAAAFGLHLLGHDPVVDPQKARAAGVRLVELDQLLAESDFVSLHAPLTAATRGVINRQSLARMKPGSILVNTARGGLIVEEDLREALQSGHLAGAGLDVLVTEPPPADHPLFSLDNVVFSPHVAANDSQAIDDMALGAAKNIVELYQGRWPDDSVINPAVQSGWSWSR